MGNYGVDSSNVADLEKIKANLEQVKHIVLVLSGKGGVGKTTVTANLAWGVATQDPNYNVGVLDVDICGPSLPRMLGADGEQVHMSGDGWTPVKTRRTFLVSLSLLDYDFAKFIPFKSEGIWCYYLRDGSGQNAQCIACKRILKSVGGSTKGMHVHQKAVHGIETSKRKVKDEVDTQTPAKNTPKISILDHFSSVSIDRSTDAVLARMIALDGLPFSVFVTSKDLRKCLNALGHEIPLSAETIKIKVCRYADTFREKVVRELQMEKEKGQLFSLTLDEWTSIRSKRYLNINIHSRTKVLNLGLTRISGVFSSEQCKYVIGAKLLEFGIDFETDIVWLQLMGAQ
ncbi:hypothetical protein LAZ67_1002661 [Cordylochernes scorpioides]|uniref:Uncharacterized protein n=1 Tax=Cordylochernes scorpioides TaxID=51811 RepID=A0ABY6JXC1_9ARAC|nr:hypothetical protein LAZ67_1002661 [Cordylochernes scorpioides]